MTEETLFSEAVTKPHGERAAFLAAIDDLQLRQRVEKLLAAYDPTDKFLEPVTTPHATSSMTANILGSTIGPYRVVKQLGEGGMGLVFLAEQEAPIRRQVALKIIKPGCDTEQVIARFEAERQAVAMMDHPNIAKVIDAGVIPFDSSVAMGGLALRPYFVMELINGTPITRFCDDCQLTPKQRLELFIPVCQAIQHAHQKGIIHRDLKPSNVLVAMYDGRPSPKIIDFGVAKATHQRLTDRTMSTGLGQIIGTLEYMSPEQAESNAVDIDTRSDVYSLGVLLYELLTGSTPLAEEHLKQAGLLEMLRIIREEEPVKPSTRLSQSGDALPSISAMRKMEPAKLSKLLRGDLDWVVMKCLEKDRSRRYATANGLARDLERYLADESVEACPPTPAYRFKKFLHRNHRSVAAAALGLFLLIAGFVGTTWGLLRAEQQRKVAEDERDAKGRALAAEQKARDNAMTALRDITTDIVENQMARGATLTEENKELLRKLIEHFDGLSVIVADHVEGRSIRAEGRFRVGLMRHRLGELKDAEVAYRDALDLRKQLASEYPERPEFQQDLADCHSHLGILLDVTGRPKEAESEFNEALALRKQLTAKFSSRTEFQQKLATSHLNLGIFLSATSRLKEGEEAYQEFFKLQRKLAAEFPARPELRRELAKGLNNLGALLRGSGRMKEAEAAYREAMDLRKQLAAEFPSRPEHRQDLARSFNSLSILLKATNRPKESEEATAQSIALQKQLAADYPTRPDIRQELARSQNNLATVLRAGGRMKEAETAHTEALTLRKQLVADFPMQSEYRQELSASHNNLGILYRDTNRLKEAEAAYREAWILRKQLAADFPDQPDRRNDFAGTCANLANLCNQLDDFAAAKAYVDEAEPHHAAALKSSANNPTYRQHYRLSLFRLTGAYAGLLQPAEALRTAERIRDLDWDSPGNAAFAAGALSQCIPIMQRHKNLDEAARQSAAQSYGDEAMKMLNHAVVNGFTNAESLKKNTDLDPIRNREDFKSLVATMESNSHDS